jgi:glucose-1-phosphate adenylyltransferase
VIGFDEKPMNPTPVPGSSDVALASMGIYIFKADVLVRALEEDAIRPDSQHDFGRNIIPHSLARRRLRLSLLRREQEGLQVLARHRTLDAYFEASMDLCHVNPEFNLYDPEWPLRTYQPQAPPAKFVFAEERRRCGQALDSVISNGCIISGSRIVGSILCPNVRVHSFCEIQQAILHARSPSRAACADSPRDHRSRCARAACGAHRLRQGRRSPSPLRHRWRHRRGHRG